ncbi:MAG: hypothetical protein AAFY36_15635 [Bacteroidota bacterium]
MAYAEHQETPKWLKSLERTSWQIEVLISGGLMFTLYSLPGSINELLYQAYLNTGFEITIFVVFMAAFVVSKALLIGFGVNLFLRAIWLALLGVHFAYPKGIDYERLNYSKAFEEEMNKRPSTLDRILWLEKWASLSYSLAIILTIGALGAVLTVALIYYFIFQPLINAGYTWFDQALAGYLILFIVALFSFGFVDRLMFRALSQKPKASRRYFRVSRVLGYLNLTQFLRRESLVIVSNNNRWRIHLLRITYFLVALFVSLYDLELNSPIAMETSLLDTRGYKNIPAFRYVLENDDYEDMLEAGEFVEEASIPSEVIQGSTLPLFVTYDQYFDSNFKYVEDSLGLIPKYRSGMTIDSFTRNTAIIQQALNNILLVTINGQEYDSLSWYFRENTVTRQEGFYTRIPIDTLDMNARHDLVVRYIAIRKSPPDTSGLTWIPFWREE